MPCKTAKALNLRQCLDIRSNRYRSINNRMDYQPEEIDARINELQARKDARQVSALTRLYAEGITAMYDWINAPAETWRCRNGDEIIIPPVICPF
jgi:hypothetical protein